MQYENLNLKKLTSTLKLLDQGLFLSLFLLFIYLLLERSFPQCTVLFTVTLQCLITTIVSCGVITFHGISDGQTHIRRVSAQCLICVCKREWKFINIFSNSFIFTRCISTLVYMYDNSIYR